MIEITPYHILAPLFSLIMILYAWNLAFKHKKTIWEALLWTVFWAAVGYISLFPNSLRYLSDFTGIKKNENAAIFTSIGVIFFIIFYLVIRIEELQQRITKLVRQEALEDAEIGTGVRKEQ